MLQRLFKALLHAPVQATHWLWTALPGCGSSRPCRARRSAGPRGAWRRRAGASPPGSSRAASCDRLVLFRACEPGSSYSAAVTAPCVRPVRRGVYTIRITPGVPTHACNTRNRHAGYYWKAATSPTWVEKYGLCLLVHGLEVPVRDDRVEGVPLRPLEQLQRWPQQGLQPCRRRLV